MNIVVPDEVLEFKFEMDIHTSQRFGLSVKSHGKIDDTIDYVDVSVDDNDGPSYFVTEMLKVVNQGEVYIVCFVWKGRGYVGCLGET
jgi:hypothetical protein